MANDPENPARWLPDPTGRHEHRYWNGSSWTDDVANRGVTGKDPLAAETVAAAPRGEDDGGETSGTPAVEAPVTERVAPTAALVSSPPQTDAKKVWYKRKLVWIGAAIAALIVIAGIAGAGKDSNRASSAKVTAKNVPTLPPSTRTEAPTTRTAAPTSPTVPATTQAPKPTAPPAPVETPGQANAQRSAQQYLSLGSGFSRAGLIAQLSSPYGAGFSVEDATYGVDATHTDWNAQACLSAKNYLEISPFSHAALVEQLSSDFGAQFTQDEAEYGVTCAGL